MSQIPVEENIRSISYTQDKVGLVTDNVEGGDPYRLKLYDKEGNQIFEKSFNYQYTGFDIDGDLVLLYNDSSCKVYNMTGTEKYNGTFDFTVSKVSGIFETVVRNMPREEAQIYTAQLRRFFLCGWRDIFEGRGE